MVQSNYFAVHSYSDILFRNRMVSPSQLLVSIRFREIRTKVRTTLIQLNIFKTFGDNEHEIYYQRIATRVYIFFLVISLATLTFYSLLIEKIQRETVLDPSESEFNRLEQLYSTSLTCPCSFTSMNYSTFIDIKPHHHQLCSSDLVSTEWIAYNDEMDPHAIYRFNDYRGLSSNYFRLLAMFCRKAQETNNDALEAFLQTQLISAQVIPQQLFEYQFNSSIRNWQSNTLERFLLNIQLVQAIHSGNQLYSNLGGIVGRMTGEFGEVIFQTEQSPNNCSCALTPSCRSGTAIFDLEDYSNEGIQYFSIPNFFAGCFPVEALYQSTLECFYNRSCMIKIDQHMYSPLGASFNFSSLDSSRNWPNETIGSIIHRLMVDSWDSNVSFSSYYKICAPLSCTFEYIGRNDIFYVVITIIGVFGGLSLGWKILILTILRLIEKLIHNCSLLKVKRIFKNLFICHTNHQIITRLHFTLLTITLGIVYTLSASTPQPTTIHIIEPSLSTYQHLTKHSPNTLQCPCSHLSAKYHLFLTIIPRFHQVCLSEFVSDRWIEYLYGEGNLGFRFPVNDFRVSASAQFRLLASLCQLSRKTMENSLLQLMENDLINSDLLSSNLLAERLQTMIDEFNTATRNLFITTLNLNREIIGSNIIMSTLSTNWQLISDKIIHREWTIHTQPVTYGECNCGVSWRCVQPSRGMMTGCYPIEALLHSTLQCFYDQECIDATGTFSKLNISSLQTSRFNMNTTIESILNHLTVEEYTTNIAYENYFNQCTPYLCTYTRLEYRRASEAITSLIGLYGSLAVITRCLAVMITKLWFYRKNRVNPGTMHR